MKYKEIKKAVFMDRPNRFCAHVSIDGKTEEVHVKNTGRCKELLLPGADIILECSDNPKRKTKYSLVSVYKGNMLVNMDSQSPNTVVYEALINGKIKEIGKPDYIKREVKYSNSRFDIYFEKDGKKGFVEVKGVTLENDMTASFPDAPTSRGTKHLNELMSAKADGYEAFVFFLIQMKGPNRFVPNEINDLLFAKTLRQAAAKGVNILAYDCNVTENTLEIGNKIEVFI